MPNLLRPLVFLPLGPLLAVLVVSAMFLPRIVVEGQFVDGLTYAAVSRNLAEGYGTWWKIEGSVRFGSEVFYEHPPLVFWLQSLFFRVFGDVWWADKVFCALVLLGTLAALSWVWCLLLGHDEQRRPYFWLAAVLWYITPTVSWGMPCNMLEGPLALLTLCAVGCGLRAGLGSWGWLAASGLLTLFAFLAKGPAGLFPLAMPLLAQQFFWEKNSQHRDGKLVLRAVLPALVCAICFGLLMLHDPARHFFQTYWQGQVLQSLSGQREMSGQGLSAHLHLLRAFFGGEGLPALGIAALLCFLGKKRDPNILLTPTPAVWFALWVFASAALPLLLSVKQRTYYLMPAMPWLAIALAAWAAPSVSVLRGFFSAKKLHVVRALLWIALFGVAFFSIKKAGTVSREPELVGMLYQMQTIVPQGVDICVCPDTYGSTTPAAYLYRYGRWEAVLEPEGALPAFALVERSRCPESFEHRLRERGFAEKASVGDWVLMMENNGRLGSNLPHLPRPRHLSVH